MKTSTIIKSILVFLLAYGLFSFAYIGAYILLYITAVIGGITLGYVWKKVDWKKIDDKIK